MKVSLNFGASQLKHFCSARKMPLTLYQPSLQVFRYKQREKVLNTYLFHSVPPQLSEQFLMS